MCLRLFSRISYADSSLPPSHRAGAPLPTRIAGISRHVFLVTRADAGHSYRPLSSASNFCPSCRTPRHIAASYRCRTHSDMFRHHASLHLILSFERPLCHSLLASPLRRSHAGALDTYFHIPYLPELPSRIQVLLRTPHASLPHAHLSDFDARPHLRDLGPLFSPLHLTADTAGGHDALLRLSGDSLTRLYRTPRILVNTLRCGRLRRRLSPRRWGATSLGRTGRAGYLCLSRDAPRRDTVADGKLILRLNAR